MVGGFLSSQVIFPSLPPAIYPFLLYHITILVYHGMPFQHSTNKSIQKLLQEIIAKLAKMLSNDTSIYHHMQQYHHQYYHTLSHKCHTES